MNDNSILENLTKVIPSDRPDLFYPCIQDLVENGLDLARFTSTEERRPLRQDITHYLATWCRQIGLTDEESRSWLVDYCVNRLSVISKTSASGIRHSTKSNIKFIYKSNIQFVCEQESNPFKAKCLKSCSVYSEMKKKNAEKKDPTEIISFEVKKPVVTAEIDYIPVKEKFKAQFEEALQFIGNQIDIGIDPKELVEQLNQCGFKTKTGRPWRFSTLRIELARRRKDSSN